MILKHTFAKKLFPATNNHCSKVTGNSFLFDNNRIDNIKPYSVPALEFIHQFHS